MWNVEVEEEGRNWKKCRCEEVRDTLFIPKNVNSLQNVVNLDIIYKTNKRNMG